MNKKTFAAVTAALAAMLTISTSVSAMERTDLIEQKILSGKATQEDLFVASFDNIKEMRAADYFLGNGVSLDSTVNLSDLVILSKYVNGTISSLG